MSRLLRLDLPDEVWDRLNAEAAAKGQKIGVYAKGLILARDARMQKKAGATDSTNQTR